MSADKILAASRRVYDAELERRRAMEACMKRRDELDRATARLKCAQMGLHDAKLALCELAEKGE